MRLLVVDDDVALRDLLLRVFERDGHSVVATDSARGAQEAVADAPVDVVVLDLDLPDASGVEVCKALRAAGSNVPILMLTAHSAIANRVASLDSGADDFLGKPFAVAELCARVRALGRRRDLSYSTPLKTRNECRLDFSSRKATRGEESVSLTPREWSLLEALAHRRGRLAARNELLEAVWGEANESTSASLHVLVTRIRRKLGSETVRTHRGGGYVLELE